jgi:hypothetical protein
MQRRIPYVAGTLRVPSAANRYRTRECAYYNNAYPGKTLGFYPRTDYHIH